ncbi:MAG: hypothetical protein LBL31_00510 [Spirochaetaceae bacterium]|jgi:hypothetical protein|nr:hypothetical protein [Spirochaetaceae bacterium]
MKTKRFFFGLPVVLLAVSASLTLGLVLTGCGGDDDDPVAKSVTITGINQTALTNANQVAVLLTAEMPESGMPTFVALRYRTVSGGTLSADLVVPANGTYESNTRWTGSGSYYVFLIPISGSSLDTNSVYAYVGDTSVPAKAAFNEATVTLPFAKFAAAQSQ